MVLDNLKGFLKMFLVLGILASLGVIVLASVQGGLSNAQACGQADAEVVSGACVNVSNNSQSLGSLTVAYNSSQSSQDGVLNLTSQFDSAGTIAGIAAIVLAAMLILGYFGFGRRQ